MWSHLIKLVSLSKGALVVGVAASAAMVSNAEFSNAPSHNELPSATLSAIVSAPPPKTDVVVTAPKATEKPTTQNTNATPTASPKVESGLAHGEVPQVIKDCVEKYLAIREQGDSASTADRRATGEVCRAALAQSGLTGAEFWARFGLDKQTTAPKTETTNSVDLEAMIKECVSQYLAGTADRSDKCRKAIAASGLTPQEFWTKFGPNADRAKGELSPEALAMARECVTKYNAKSTDASTTCKKAIELSGLTSAKFAAKFIPRATGTKPTATPKSSTSDETYQLIAYCIKLRNAITSTSEQERVNAVSQACAKAIFATGLSSIEFWTKFGKELTNNPYTTKPSTKLEPTASPKPVTNTAELSPLVANCLQLYAAVSSTGDTHAASDACGAAIRASGMNSVDFWAKYHPITN